MSEKKRTRFMNGLRNAGFDPEDVINNFRYVGGSCIHNIPDDKVDTGRCRDMKTKCVSCVCNTHINYFKIAFAKNRKKPHLTRYCVCGSPIITNCYVADKTNERVVVLGSCCVKEFMKKSGRTCEECGCFHKNRKNNLCNDCRNNEVNISNMDLMNFSALSV